MYPVLIYGAGRSGVAVVRELFRNSPPGLRPIGFIDDDVRKRGKLVSELPVFGTEREVEGIIHTHAARAVLIATEKIPQERIARAVEVCKGVGVPVLRLNIQVERLVEGAVSGALGGPIYQIPTIPPGPSRATAVVETLNLLGAEACPSCGSQQMQRSKLRTLVEKLRKTYTSKRLFRCQRCGWRGWLRPLDPVACALNDRVEPLDLSSIDDAPLEAPVASGTGDR